jgi:VanZ family protein
VLNKYVVLVLALLYSITLTVLSFISFSADSITNINYGDKVFHLGAHMVLVILVFCSAYKFKLKKALILAILFSIIYGIIIEVLQERLTTDRQFDTIDMVANSLGALLAAAFLRMNNKTIVKYL